MKKTFVFCSVLFLAFFHLQAATITAIQNGSWSAASTWDLNRTPTDNDVVVIQSGITVNLINTPYAANNITARPTLQIKIYGILDFSNPGNDKLYLDNNSTIQVHAGGKIQTSLSSTEIIAIYNGTFDNNVWNGAPTTINGDAFASASSNGFTAGILPLSLMYFKAEVRSRAVKLLWEATAEINTALFIVESYNTTLSSWQTIGQVAAAGNSTQSNTYSFLAPLPATTSAQYRLKCKDIDGDYSYSTVYRISLAATASVKVLYQPALHRLQFQGAEDESNKWNIALFNFSGKIILKKEVKGTNILYLPLPFLIPGAYIIQLTSTDKPILSEKIWVD